MAIAKILTGCLIVAAFGGGLYLGMAQVNNPVVNTSEGVGYSGGFKQASPGNKTKVVVKKTPGKTHVVNDGDSIMATVKLAKSGDTLQIMPGSYHETVYIDKDDIRIVRCIRCVRCIIFVRCIRFVRCVRCVGRG